MKKKKLTNITINIIIGIFGILLLYSIFNIIKWKIDSKKLSNQIDNINDIEMYKGKDLLVTREDAVPLEEGEYFIADLLDLDVYSDEDEKIGVLYDVMQTGANDVYVVKTEEGKEILLPAIDECILDINLEESRMTVHIMEGLLD